MMHEEEIRELKFHAPHLKLRELVSGDEDTKLNALKKAPRKNPLCDGRYDSVQTERLEKLKLVGLDRCEPSDKWRDLMLRKPRRVPRYLREDFPKVSMAGSANMDGITLKSARRKRRRARRKAKQHKATVCIAAPKIPPPPELSKLLRERLKGRTCRTQAVSTEMSSGLESLLYAPAPPRIPKPRDLGPRGGGASLLRAPGSAVLRINDKLMNLQPAKAAAAFLDTVEEREASQQDKMHRERTELREKGQDYVFSNVKTLQKSADEHRLEDEERRRNLMAELQASLEKARQRKSELDAERAAKIQLLIIKHKSEAERQAMRTQKQHEAHAYLVAIVNALCGSKLKSVAQSLGTRRRLREATVRIQRNIRMWRAMRQVQVYREAKERIVRFFRSVVFWRKKRRQRWYAQSILQFLVDNRVNFGQIIRDYRYRVIKCQRFARMFLSCTQARVAALTRIWVHQERRLVAKARALHLKTLEKHTNRLEEEAHALQKTAFHEQMSAKWMRQITLPEQVCARGDTETKDGTVRFPVGMHLKVRQENSPSARVEAQYKAQISKNVNFIMDFFLNEEFQSRLARERAQPLSFPPVSREIRYEILRDVVSHARSAHQLRMAKLKRERKVLETQKVKVDISEAQKLLSEQTNIVTVTKTLFSDLGRQQIVLLFSTIDHRDIFRLVQKAQVQLVQTNSMKQLLFQVRYD